MYSVYSVDRQWRLGKSIPFLGNLYLFIARNDKRYGFPKKGIDFPKHHWWSTLYNVCQLSAHIVFYLTSFNFSDHKNSSWPPNFPIKILFTLWDEFLEQLTSPIIWFVWSPFEKGNSFGATWIDKSPFIGYVIHTNPRLSWNRVIY